MLGAIRSAGAGGAVDLASPGAIGGTTPNTASFTDLTIRGRRSAPPLATQNLTAGSVISPNADTVAIAASSAITLTSNPQISAGLDNQYLMIQNIGSNGITFANGNGLILGQSIPLYPGKMMSLRYLPTYLSWVLDSLIPESVALTGSPTVSDQGLNSGSSAIANTRYVNQSNRPALRAYRATTNQSGLNHNAFTQLIFNTEALDTGLIHDTATGLITIPANAAGLWLISVGMYLNGNNQTLAIGVFNGATEIQRLNDTFVATDLISAIKGSVPVQLSGGDVINIRGFYANSTAAARQMISDPALSFLTMFRLNV
jgi:hypothetical protein